MDLYLLMGWVLLCDVIMVLLVRWMTMKETDKARQEVLVKYSEALERVSALSNDIKTIKIPPYPKIPTVDEIIAKIPPYPVIPPIVIPEDQLEKLRESITGAINGCVGAYTKKVGAAVAEEDDLDIGQVLMQSIMKKFTK